MNIKRKSILLGSLIMAFLFVTFLVIKNDAFVINLDNTIHDWVTNHQSPAISNLMSSITKIGDIYSVITIFLIFGLFLLIKNVKALYTFALATGLGIVLTEVIKYLIQRVRPYNLLEQGFSFPSAHAMIATIFFLSSILLLVPLIKKLFSKNIFLITTSIVFPLVALSRIYLSVHFTSDVFAGIILGLICFTFSEIVCCHKKENVL